MRKNAWRVKRSNRYSPMSMLNSNFPQNLTQSTDAMFNVCMLRLKSEQCQPKERERERKRNRERSSSQYTLLILYIDVLFICIRLTCVCVVCTLYSIHRTKSDRILNKNATFRRISKQSFQMSVYSLNAYEPPWFG